MRITALTSMYKGGKYIEGFLKDILDQTYFSKTEWYLLDCNSPDNEYSIIKPYLKSYPNIKYEQLDETISVYGAWNYMIENSEGEYLTNANLDDRLYPFCVEKHVSYLDQHPEYDLAYCANLMTKVDNDSYLNHIYDVHKTIYPTGPFDRNNLINHCYPSSHPVWRRSLHINFGMFDDTLRSAGDLEFWLRCIHGGSQDFVYIPEILGIYYFNPDGLSTSQANNDWRSKEEEEVRRKYR